MVMEIVEKDNLPDVGERVLVLCEKLGQNGESVILVAEYLGDNEWYSFFPYDQPVYPTHWGYSILSQELKIECNHFWVTYNENGDKKCCHCGEFK